MFPDFTRPQGLTRREFTVDSVLALLAGVTITVTGCGGTTPTTPSATTPPTGATSTQPDVSGTISANHGHVATVTGVQIVAANAISLNIQGSATHAHTVALSGDQLRAIGAKQQVAVNSSTDNSHSHTVTFN